MLNALTIDVEDYFQVHAFSKVIKCDDWEGYECRIERNTDRLLEILESVRGDFSSEPQNRSAAALDNLLTHSPNNSLTQEGNDSSGLPPCAMPYAPCVAPRATFFILGWIAERYPDLVRKIQKEGHEIACHGYAHKLIYNQSKEEFRQDIRKAKAMLEDITGSEIVGYRAPSYSITTKSQWAFEILMEEGFKYDSSVFPIRHDFYGFPNAPRFPFMISVDGNGDLEFSKVLDFKQKQQHSDTAALNKSSTHSLINPVSDNIKFIAEFPISTVRLLGQNLPISGGGYFRLFPYSVIEKGLKSINEEENRPFIFYVHPWELDPDQPKINGLSLKSKFRHYVNLDKTGDRFKKLLKNFNFSPVRDILGLTDVLTQ